MRHALHFLFQERSLLLTELGEQNQRLGRQLGEAEEAAVELRGQVRALREQAEAERESVREQSSYVDNLRGEVVQGRDQRNHLQAHILRWDTLALPASQCQLSVWRKGGQSWSRAWRLLWARSTVWKSESSPESVCVLIPTLGE